MARFFVFFVGNHGFGLQLHEGKNKKSSKPYKNIGLGALDAPGFTKTMVWQPWALLGLQKQWFGSFGRSWAYKNNGLGALEASNATIVTPDAFEASSFRIPYGSPNGFTKGILTKGFT